MPGPRREYVEAFDGPAAGGVADDGTAAAVAAGAVGSAGAPARGPRPAPGPTGPADPANPAGPRDPANPAGPGDPAHPARPTGPTTRGTGRAASTAAGPATVPPARTSGESAAGGPAGPGSTGGGAAVPAGGGAGRSDDEPPAGARRRAGHAGSGGKGRTFAGIAAAAVTTVLAVVVAGQVTAGSDDDARAAGGATERAEEPSAKREGRPTPPAPPPPPSYEEKLATKFPLSPGLKGSGKFTTVPGRDKAPGRGEVVRYRVDVEQGLPLETELFVRAVQETLNDNRSWANGGRRTFERVSSGDARFVISLASPGTTGVWCAKSGLDTTQDNVSCDSAATERIMINAYRWAQGAETFRDDQTLIYRQMLINHEVGHRLGRGHEQCGKDGALAPVMMQQTKVLKTGNATCRANAWPFPDAKGGKQR
ncbi:DUF3152 domain-containing protein [Streptomyces sp. 796.1]|uniref:DUF3152 domain-containing protein n=1 Tax=Streptomyces sp. 796.1 TaxID=3163029 RepID=UPI0039C8E244